MPEAFPRPFPTEALRTVLRWGLDWVLYNPPGEAVAEGSVFVMENFKPKEETEEK